MCDACVIESVKAQMLSRRALFQTAAAGVAAAAVTAPMSAPALADGHGKVEDMTHELHEDFPTYFGAQQFFKDQKFNFKDNGFNLFELRVNEHTGTHVDAPLHFSADGQSVAEIPTANLICP
ncbi:MAG: cyclase family protein, partial [Pseudomonadota bacterium]